VSTAGHAPDPGDDDATVIERSWREPAEFGVLFDRYAPRIHRYVTRRVGRDVADDLMAETFLAAFGKRRRYDLRYADAMPWLYGIATNLIGQHRREEARQFRIQRAARPEPELPGHSQHLRARPGRHRARAKVRQALALACSSTTLQEILSNE
jgi:DNA-directed RNA polymerase specialized sigma24 family protein